MTVGKEEDKNNRDRGCERGREELLTPPEEKSSIILFWGEELPNGFNIQIIESLTPKNFLPANSQYSNQLEEMW